MASAKDFNRLAQINGVAHYILVRGDGQIISQNMEDAASLGPIIAAGGTKCDALTADMGGNRYIHLCIERESGNDLLVFSLGRYYLGILKHAESPRQEIIDNVIYFLKNLS
ncbi:MAG: roadblock/LC7 domain-containing protein [Desulfocapsaceae bacterium]|nr:roadblock/LC7 domain-containing protein [Desulfocapsaceae bacterium]